MIVRNVPHISFIAAPWVLGSKKATSIVTRGGLEQSQGARAGAKTGANVAQAMQIAQDSALPDIVRLDTLARYQVSLDRQLSKIIGEIQILHAANKVKPVQVIEQ